MSSITGNHFPVIGGSILKKQSIELRVASLYNSSASETAWQAKKDLIAIGSPAAGPVIDSWIYAN